MNKPSLLLIGAGGHARSCIDVIEQQGHYKIAGLVGLPDEVDTSHLDYLIIGSDRDLYKLSKIYEFALITIGQIKTAEPRMNLFYSASELGFKFPIIISPAAQVSRHATLGVGTIVMHGAIINAGATVGENCIINNRALLEHEVCLANHCHISTGAILNGNVKVGPGSFIGSGSLIKEGVVIGAGCVVGMGLTVRHKLKDKITFLGV